MIEVGQRWKYFNSYIVEILSISSSKVKVNFIYWVGESAPPLIKDQKFISDGLSFLFQGKKVEYWTLVKGQEKVNGS